MIYKKCLQSEEKIKAFEKFLSKNKLINVCIEDYDKKEFEHLFVLYACYDVYKKKVIYKFGFEVSCITVYEKK